MSYQVLRIPRPTKIELIRLRRRLAVARRLHKVLRDRLIILSQELISLVKDAINLRTELHRRVSECERYLLMSHSVSGSDVIDLYTLKRVGNAVLVKGFRVVAGVRVPLYEVEIEGTRDVELSNAPILAELTVRCYEECVKTLVKLAEVEESIMLIGKEVSRIKRRVNALEHFLIPRILNTIKYLRMKFEERERENKVRVKRIKEILERRSATLS